MYYKYIILSRYNIDRWEIIKVGNTWNKNPSLYGILIMTVMKILNVIP